jgi:hypothetical protein
MNKNITFLSCRCVKISGYQKYFKKLTKTEEEVRIVRERFNWRRGGRELMYERNSTGPCWH